MEKLLPLLRRAPCLHSLLTSSNAPPCALLLPKVAAFSTPSVSDAQEGDFPNKSHARLNTMFTSKPLPLDLPQNSSLRVEDPKFEGFRHTIMKLLLFYSKQSTYIRGANVVYKRITSQIDAPAIYDVFHLEKTFKTTFSLLVLHMWLLLHRLKGDGKEGTEFGQYLYEIYNYDLEVRVSKAGVNLLLIKWMKELEKIFYGNVIAYDRATSPDASKDELSKILWRNVFSDDGSDKPCPPAALASVQALARYTRRESACLSLTGKESIFSGNFVFTSLEDYRPNSEDPAIRC